MSKRAMEAEDEPGSVWMLKNGSATINASTLDTTLLQPFETNSPPAGMAAITKFLSISQTGILTWVMDHDAYTEPSTPILYGNSSDGWNANTTLHLPFNSTIDLIMAVANDSMDTVSLSHSCNSCQYLVAFASFPSLMFDIQDGTPHAPSRAQVLGFRLWEWTIPILFYRCRSLVCNQPS